MALKRTFIAIKINPGQTLMDIFNLFRKDLTGERIKWVDPNNLHLTLKFLGDTDETIIPFISGIIEKTASKYPAFDLIFNGAGIFRNLHDPKVIWIGTEENLVLRGIKKDLDGSLKSAGFAPEEGDYRAHLTIARIKFLRNKAALERLLNTFRDKVIQEEKIREIVFYESILKPEGPEYIILSKASLGE